jgi:hypothetical protein
MVRWLRKPMHHRSTVVRLAQWSWNYFSPIHIYSNLISTNVGLLTEYICDKLLTKFIQTLPIPAHKELAKRVLDKSVPCVVFMFLVTFCVHLSCRIFCTTEKNKETSRSRVINSQVTRVATTRLTLDWTFWNRFSVWDLSHWVTKSE